MILISATIYLFFIINVWAEIPFKSSVQNISYSGAIPFANSAKNSSLQGEVPFKNIKDQSYLSAKNPIMQNHIISTQQNENGNSRFSWLYIAVPLGAIFGMLTIFEVNRKKEHIKLTAWHRNNKSEALKNYAAANLKKGFKQEQIKNALIKNNYNNQEIEEAFKGIR